MKTNLLVITLLSLAAISAAVFLFLKNQKDKKELERKINEPANPKTKTVSDTEVEDRDKI